MGHSAGISPLHLARTARVQARTRAPPQLRVRAVGLRIFPPTQPNPSPKRPTTQHPTTHNPTIQRTHNGTFQTSCALRPARELPLVGMSRVNRHVVGATSPRNRAACVLPKVSEWSDYTSSLEPLRYSRHTSEPADQRQPPTPP